MDDPSSAVGGAVEVAGRSLGGMLVRERKAVIEGKVYCIG